MELQEGDLPQLVLHSSAQAAQFVHHHFYWMAIIWCIHVLTVYNDILHFQTNLCACLASRHWLVMVLIQNIKKLFRLLGWDLSNSQCFELCSVCLLGQNAWGIVESCSGLLGQMLNYIKIHVCGKSKWLKVIPHVSGSCVHWSGPKTTYGHPENNSGQVQWHAACVFDMLCFRQVDNWSKAPPRNEPGSGIRQDTMTWPYFIIAWPKGLQDPAGKTTQTKPAKTCLKAPPSAAKLAWLRAADLLAGAGSSVRKVAFNEPSMAFMRMECLE